jgi:hypothetical protein
MVSLCGQVKLEIPYLVCHRLSLGLSIRRRRLAATSCELASIAHADTHTVVAYLQSPFLSCANGPVEESA